MSRISIGLLVSVVTMGGCGLESIFFQRDFIPTPPPHASIKGRIAGVPSQLESRLSGVTMTARAVTTDGRVLASTDARTGQEFTLDLEPNLGDQYNVRVLVGAGAAQLRAMATLVTDGQETGVGDVGGASTAAQLLVEAYAASARSGLAGTPPSVSGRVMTNALDAGIAEVGEFHSVVTRILDAAQTNAGEQAFDDAQGEPTDAALTAASVSREDYERIRAAAVDVVGVPVVCDPSRIRVMFTAEVSGQALDGNGKKQFMRQAPKEGRVFLGITLDPSSPVPDAARSLKSRLMPNDTDTEMFDDGTHGDEVPGDQVFTTTLVLPRGMRVIYKFTNGSPGEGYTGTEEWPGNARILEVVDVITSNPSGAPDCLVIRRDSFGDESSNKNFVNLHSSLAGGALSFDADLGGDPLTPASSTEALPVAGLTAGGLKEKAPLTPIGIPEARENGSCEVCPPPVTVPVDDSVPPAIISARFSATDQVQVLFTEDLDLGTAAAKSSYLVVDENNNAVPIRNVLVAGALVTLDIDPVDPRKQFMLHVKDVADASLDRNPVSDDTKVSIASDTVAPTLVEALPATITDVNPSARPVDPRLGEVILVRFSELLDRIAAENTGGYRIRALDGDKPVHAAFQRGRDVLLVTDALAAGAEYTVEVAQVFDVAGNVITPGAFVTVTGVRFHKVQLNAVPGHAWLSVDGSTRGLPAGAGLYITGTLTQSARALDGADLRVTGRPDVAGREGYRMSEVMGELVSGKPVHRLELLLPPGSYAFKYAYARPSDVAAPPATLETVTKSLVTTADAHGVEVDPITLIGRDGLSYAGARLSLTGEDAPGQGILFKRENPDLVVTVGNEDVVAPTHIIGTWRDVPFGRGQDYDDGLREIPPHAAGIADVEGPRPIAAEARDSESVVVSFDEAISPQAVDLVATVTDESGVVLASSVLAAALPRPNQAVLRTGPMQLATGYTVLVSRSADVTAHVTTEMRTVAFTSPGSFAPFTPVVDSEPPRVLSVTADGPTSILVRFSERVAPSAADPSRFSIEERAGGSGPVVASARLIDAGRAVALTTGTQEFQGAYRLDVEAIPDLATPPNVLESQSIDFEGFGDDTAPELVWARAVSPNVVVLKFSETIDHSSASSAPNYLINGLSVESALASNSPSVSESAFNGDWAPRRSDLVVIRTQTMQAARAYTITATSVLDPSGNSASTTADFMGVAEAPKVDVVLTYLISSTATVIGVGSGGSAGVPSRAVSPARLSSEREGVFVKGTALTEDGTQPIEDHPLTSGLDGFPEEGSPLEGAEPKLRDDGMGGDAMAGDNVHTILVPDVPLGSVVSYKAFASYSTAYRDAHPEDPLASFADATPGPFVFTDGQEYPGNDNAAWLLADENGDGRVVLDNLFGDEISFKRKTGFRPFAWVTDSWRRLE